MHGEQSAAEQEEAGNLSSRGRGRKDSLVSGFCCQRLLMDAKGKWEREIASAQPELLDFYVGDHNELHIPVFSSLCGSLCNFSQLDVNNHNAIRA